MTSTKYTFRAIWPIFDETMRLSELIGAARRDLANVAARSHAELIGRGHWSIVLSSTIPGSGRITETVLLYTGPAVEVLRKGWKDAA